MVRQYYPHPIKDVDISSAKQDPEAATQLVLDLMQGVNLVAAAEAVAFARSLGVDMAQFFELVSDAAGGSKIFVTRGLEMIEDRIGAQAPAGTETVDEVVSRLETVVQKAREIHCPVHLGNAALSVLLMAKGKGIGGEGSTSVIGVYPSYP